MLQRIDMGREPEMDLGSYEQVLRDAAEDVCVLALRNAIDPGHLLIEFDANRASGRYRVHTLTISLRDSEISATADNVPHEWLSMGTGFIDVRLSRVAQMLLAEIEKRARAPGRIP